MMEQAEKVCREMPVYQCHKKVWALKIKEIRQSDAQVQHDGGSWDIFPEDDGYGPITVPHSFVVKYEPKVGGYYVVYEGGYASFSPADAFESGYTNLTDGDEFRRSIARAINAHSLEQNSNTPDFILARYLDDCLKAFDFAMKRRNDWYR